MVVRLYSSGPWNQHDFGYALVHTFFTSMALLQTGNEAIMKRMGNHSHKTGYAGRGILSFVISHHREKPYALREAFSVR
jgi:hypothetical protein